MDQYIALKQYLQSLGRLCIGYSGGVDSAFLLNAAYEALGDNVCAIIADGPMMARRDFADAIAVVEGIGANYTVIKANPLAAPELKENIKKRCYYCKKNIFGLILEKARELGFDKVADGKNTDDAKVYRPGAQAIDELGVYSPLYHCGFSKADIRQYSKELGLPTWDKPSNSCLFTRIPYNEEVTLEKLQAIENTEDLLRDEGLAIARVRAHGALARIEVAKENFQKVLEIEGLAETFRANGFKYITLDLEGFASGSLDR